MKDRTSRSDWASSRDLSIFSTHRPYTFDIPSSRRALAVGAVSKTYTSYSSLNIRSTMFSNIADSSKAGFIVAASTNSSAFVEISANLRNHWIFSRISRFERSIASFVSISWAHRLSTPWIGVALPNTSWSRAPVRLWTGFVEASSVRLPLRARWTAVVAAMTVLPTPPLPPKKT